MGKAGYVIWAAAAWLTPAVAAGALGWTGVWGTGSAFTDFLLPIPITGGALHVPSFVALIAVTRLYGRVSDRWRALLRAACIGTALVGAAMLVDLEAVHVYLTTDLATHGLPTHENPVGLFLLTDALWGAAWTARRPSWRTVPAASIAVALLPPLGYVATALTSSTRIDAPFVQGRSLPGDRGDESMYVFARLATGDPSFRTQALAFVAPYRPEHDVNVSDRAILFTASLDTAEGLGDAPIELTLCLYEDGTPDRWLPGRGDCFADHESFDDRVRAAFAALPPEVPREIAAFLVTERLCADYVRGPDLEDGLARGYRCHRFDREGDLRVLRERQGEEALVRWLGPTHASPAQ